MTIQFRLKELIAKKERLEGANIPYLEIQKEARVSPNTLTKMANQRLAYVGVDTIDRLCAYFDCEVGDLIIRVPDEQ